MNTRRHRLLARFVDARALAVPFAFAVAALAGGCGKADGGKLNVCAAASLKAAFEQEINDYKAANPGADVSLNTAGSQVLKSQIEAGAPCDVLATADEQTMDALVTSGHVLAPTRFASSSLVIVVPTANPAGLASWHDLAKAPRVALAGPDVPIGKYARKFIANADKAEPGFQQAVTDHTKTLELDVAHVMVRVRQGEVDAAVAYRTDAMGAVATDAMGAVATDAMGAVATDARGDGVTAIAIPPELDVAADYPIAVLKAAANASGAAAFVAQVLGSGGQATLGKFGFGAPRPSTSASK